MVIKEHENYLEEENDEYDVYHIPYSEEDDYYDLNTRIAINNVRAGTEIEYEDGYNKVTVYHNDDNIRRHANKYIELTYGDYTIDDNWADKSIKETYELDKESIVEDAAENYYEEHGEDDPFIDNYDDTVTMFNEMFDIDEFRRKCVKCEIRILGRIISDDRIRKIEPEVDPEGKASEEVLDLAYEYADMIEPTIEQRLEDKMPIFADEINIDNAESVVITSKRKDRQTKNQDEFDNIIIKPEIDAEEYVKNLRDDMIDSSLNVHRKDNLVHIWKPESLSLNPIFVEDKDHHQLIYRYHNTDTILEFDKAKPTDECDKMWELYKNGVKTGVVDVRGMDDQYFYEILDS